MCLSDSKTETNVDVIRSKLKWKKPIKKVKAVKSDSDSNSNDEVKSCRKCGLKHLPSKCAAYGETCFKCGKKNYFSRMCGKHARKGHARFTKKSVAEMELTDDEALDMFEYD